MLDNKIDRLPEIMVKMGIKTNERQNRSSKPYMSYIHRSGRRGRRNFTTYDRGIRNYRQRFFVRVEGNKLQAKRL